MLSDFCTESKWIFRRVSLASYATAFFDGRNAAYSNTTSVPVSGGKVNPSLRISGKGLQANSQQQTTAEDRRRKTINTRDLGDVKPNG